MHKCKCGSKCECSGMSTCVGVEVSAGANVTISVLVYEVGLDTSVHMYKSEQVV